MKVLELNKSVVQWIALTLISIGAYGQDATITLWPGPAPVTGSSGEEIQKDDELLWITNVQDPTLEVYLPTKRSADQRGVVICPGGGYQGLAYDWEGTDVAKFLNAHGIAGIVLKYRLPGEETAESYNAPLSDAKRALRLTRKYAKDWNLDAGKIGIMGFSAGGHLASTAGTHAQPDYEPVDEADQLNAMPDFMILVYPVITMQDDFTHKGSRNSLLGLQPGDQLIELYSNHKQVNENTPPTFLVHAGDDTAVPVENSLLFHQALIKAGVPSEMHIYPRGGHGFAMAPGQDELKGWLDLMIGWIKRYGGGPYR